MDLIRLLNSVEVLESGLSDQWDLGRLLRGYGTGLHFVEWEGLSRDLLGEGAFPKVEGAYLRNNEEP